MSYEILAASVDNLHTQVSTLTSGIQEALQRTASLAKVNVTYPFTYVPGTVQYDVKVISGDATLTTAGMVLWVDGSIVYPQVDNLSKFTLQETEHFTADTKFVLIANARYDNALGTLTAAYNGEKIARIADYLNFLRGLQLEPSVPYVGQLTIERATQTVTQSGVLYRPRAELLPIVTSNWVADVSKFIPSNDLALRQELVADDGGDKVGSPVGISLASATVYVNTVAELRLLKPPVLPAGRTIVVGIAGYYAAGDGGHGCYRWQSNSNQADNGLSVFTPSAAPATGRWVAIFDNNEINVMRAGAKGIGDTFDDSFAFVAAFAVAAATKMPVRVPACPVYYVVGDVDVPYGVSLIGCADRPYTAFTTVSVQGVGGAIVKKSAATNMFRWGGHNQLTEIVMHGRDRSCRAFETIGGKIGHLRLTNCGIYRFSSGMGNPSYIGGALIVNCAFSGNTQGINSLVDSQVFGGFVNANEDVGISCPAGANDNTFIGVKNEWNNGDNWSFYMSGNNSVIGGVTDRAGGHNFRIGAGVGLTITGGTVRRGGRLIASRYNFFAEAVSKLNIVGVNTVAGFDDDGGGTQSPGICAYLRGANGQVTLSCVDMTGTIGQTLALEAGTTFNYFSVRDCPGIPDRLDRPGDVTRSGTVPAVSTLNVTIPLVPITTYTRGLYRATLTARNATTGGSIFGTFLFGTSREGGNAVALPVIVDIVSGSFGIAGTETLSVSIMNIATDGSSAEIAVKSTHATNSYVFTVTVTRA